MYVDLYYRKPENVQVILDVKIFYMYIVQRRQVLSVGRWAAGMDLYTISTCQKTSG